MKILCKSDTQVFGYGIVSKGETIDWPDGQPFPPQVLGNFRTAEGKELSNAKPQPTANGDGGWRSPSAEEAAAEQKRAERLAAEELVKKTAALGKQRLIAALDASGAAYKGNASCEELAKALLRSQGQEID